MRRGVGEEKKEKSRMARRHIREENGRRRTEKIQNKKQRNM
jgi:hypothetical protein